MKQRKTTYKNVFLTLLAGTGTLVFNPSAAQAWEYWDNFTNRVNVIYNDAEKGARQFYDTTIDIAPSVFTEVTTPFLELTTPKIIRDAATDGIRSTGIEINKLGNSLDLNLVPNIGREHKIYIHNSTSKDYYILPSKNKDWIYGDMAIDLALWTASGGISSMSNIGQVANATKSFKDFVTAIQLINTARNLVQMPVTAGIGVHREEKIRGLREKVKEDEQKVRDFLGDKGVLIKPGETVNIYERWSPLRFLTGSDVASFWGASNRSLFIIDRDLMYTAHFNTNDDHSWIIQDDAVVRAEYGTWKQPQPNLGRYDFVSVATE